VVEDLVYDLPRDWFVIGSRIGLDKQESLRWLSAIITGGFSSNGELVCCGPESRSGWQVCVSSIEVSPPVAEVVL